MHPVEAELFHPNGQTDRHDEAMFHPNGQTDRHEAMFHPNGQTDRHDEAMFHPNGQTDRHDEANIRFSQFSEKRLKTASCVFCPFNI